MWRPTVEQFAPTAAAHITEPFVRTLKWSAGHKGTRDGSLAKENKEAIIHEIGAEAATESVLGAQNQDLGADRRPPALSTAIASSFARGQENGNMIRQPRESERDLAFDQALGTDHGTAEAVHVTTPVDHFNQN